MLTDYWHIQCIHPKLETEEEKTDYVASVAIFARKVGGASNDPNTPSRLVPEEVECSSTMFDGQEKSAIKIRFRLEQPTGSLEKSVEYFCERVFGLQANSEILAKLGLITTHSLMGVFPLSSLFKYHWTKTFLRFLVHKDAPVLKDIGHAGFLIPWFKGVTLALTLLRNHNSPYNAETCNRTAAAAWAAFKDAADLEVKRPPQCQLANREKLTKKFIRELLNIFEILGEVSKQYGTQRDSGQGNESATDDEIRLFNANLDFLSCSFDLLTCEQKIFDAWKEEVFRHEWNRNVAAGVAVTGTVVVGACARVSLRSGIFLVPTFIAAVGIAYFVASQYSCGKASKEKRNAKKVHDYVGATRKAVLLLVQNSAGSSRRNSSDDTEDLPQEGNILLAEFDARAGPSDGVQTSATKLKAEVDSAMKTIQDRLEDMKQNEYLKNLFPDC
ncbi:hypothetical protein TWF569_003926 [Orbilia oligospora]|uniref:Uncharacterized protein n=1 Tax=Orbilia oligospora TaxID=2813651 RepID=A0A7C8JBK0_ORBOL|nr:hypothetical protein TWF102_005371 [Orbilia oligospora]KAF3114149.1 hypothetical protein TWF103_001571 [Orbilia oligospora]KAF3157006.1 hypothetical protein TWF569_003926 [Orbilia oligospora]